jgi:hypothetical protein
MRLSNYDDEGSFENRLSIEMVGLIVFAFALFITPFAIRLLFTSKEDEAWRRLKSARGKLPSVIT